MLSSLPTMDQLQLVISQAAAPAFILGAVASFLSVLLSHMARITDRSRAIHDLAEDDPKKERLKANLPPAAAACAYRHEPGAAALFIAALGLFTASLVSFAREVGIALKRPEAD
jgi:hypothetical protein